MEDICGLTSFHHHGVIKSILNNNNTTLELFQLIQSMSIIISLICFSYTHLHLN